MLPGIIAGMVAVFKGLMAVPALAAALPHVKAAADAGDANLTALALVQWVWPPLSSTSELYLYAFTQKKLNAMLTSLGYGEIPTHTLHILLLVPL